MRAGIAFGSNMGDRLQNLRQARACLMASALIAQPALKSSIYLTSPVDCPPSSDAFLNAVLEVDLTGTPEALLRDLRTCEEGLGRGPRTQRNGPRTIDLDLLYAGDCVLETGNLIVPHPRIAQRRFVLEPLAEIRPELVLPGQKLSVEQLLAQLPPGDSVERIDSTW